MDEMIYENIIKEEYKNQINFQPNKPSSPLSRAFSDLLGAGLIYAGTFLICDIVRTLKTGSWTGLYWMILGPWNYITGSPIITRIHETFGRTTTVQDCQDNYNQQVYEATWNRRGEQPVPDSDITGAVIDAVGDYKSCMESTRSGFPGEGCYTDAVANYNDCVFVHGVATSDCMDKYYSEMNRCQEEYIPPNCFVTAIEQWEGCNRDGKTNCDSAYFQQVYDCDQQQQ